MLRIFVLTIMFLVSATITLAGERKMNGAELKQFLPSIKASGDSSSQTFSEKGLTTYVFDGRASEGRWMIQSDQYCSSWPPNDVIECYDVLVDESRQTINWIGPRNSVTQNTYKILSR